MTKSRLSPRTVTRYLPPHKIAMVLLLVLSLMTITGFRMSSQEYGHYGEQEESSGAIERFWKVYHGNQYSRIPEVQQQLQNAIDRDPGNSTLYALLGATHFWHYGEYTRDPSLNLAVLQQDLPNAVDLFGKALEIDYYGNHLIGYVNDDHLPGYLGITTVHLGQQQNSDPATIQQGDRILDLAAYQFPEFKQLQSLGRAQHRPERHGHLQKISRLPVAGTGCMRSRACRPRQSRSETLSSPSDSNRKKEGLLVRRNARTPQL